MHFLRRDTGRGVEVWVCCFFCKNRPQGKTKDEILLRLVWLSRAWVYSTLFCSLRVVSLCLPILPLPLTIQSTRNLGRAGSNQGLAMRGKDFCCLPVLFFLPSAPREQGAWILRLRISVPSPKGGFSWMRLTFHPSSPPRTAQKAGRERKADLGLSSAQSECSPSEGEREAPFALAVLSSWRNLWTPEARLACLSCYHATRWNPKPLFKRNYLGSLIRAITR